MKFAADYLNSRTTEKWVKKIRRADPEVKAAIITMLGENKGQETLPSIIKELRNKNREVKLAAIGAVGRLGGKEALPELLRIMNDGDEQELNAVKDAL